MANLIKNQIIKHLSKFARNITADQISVQILSGHGELRDIELNEEVLAEVLELPAWLRINRATCNRISVKVPWTRLQSSPLQMFVDEIRVNVQLTSETPSQNVSNFLSGLTDSSYGFANRVVEGMSLYVNSMEVHFDSGVFGGSFMLSRLSVESRSPGWQAITNLRYSRIIDKALNQMLMFKQVTWQLLRIEASVRSDSSKRSNINAPLRLITSSGKSRISIKKSILDGAVIGGRIQVILDDILWIATLPQVRSAIAFYSHIMSVIKAAPKKIGQNLQSAILTTQKVARKTSISKTFQNFDFDQTSFHFYFGKIDLHLCDDNSDSSNFPQDWNIESGALQVTLQRISIDFYPANLAVSDRLNWVRYNAQNQCSVWVRELLEIHYRTLCSLLVANVRNRFMRIWPQLLSQNCIIRIYDLIVQCVTDSNTKKDKLFNVFMSDRNSKASVPPTEPLVHLEFTSFYHPAIESVPLPSNVTHLLLGPFSFVFDQRTIRWILYVCNDIDKTLQSSEVLLDIQNMPKTNFRIDALMPKVIVPLSSSSKADNRLPRRVVVSMSAVTAVNNENFQDSSFFKSLSSSTIDFIDSLKVPCDKSSFRNFVVHLNQNSTDGSENEERLWIKTSPIWVDTDHGEFTLSTPLLSDVAFHAVINKSATQIRIALQPQHFLRVTLDHFQYLQISHFFASFSVFIDQLEADINFFSSNSMAYIPISVICLVGNVEVNLILTRGPIPTPYDSIEDIKKFSPSFESGIADETNEEGINYATTSVTTPVIGATSGNEFEIFPQFPESDAAAESVITVDDTMSIATNVSGDEQQFIPYNAPDDVFNDMDVAVAEEALADESIKFNRSYKLELTKLVNVLTVLLDDLNIALFSFKGTSYIEGCASKLEIGEKLNEVHCDVLNSTNARCDEQKIEKITFEGSPSLRFEFQHPSDNSKSFLQVNIKDLNIDVHDEIVSHLSHFIMDEEKADSAFKLRVNVSNMRLVIIDPKTTSPLRMKINDCVIEQGDDDTRLL